MTSRPPDAPTFTEAELRTWASMDGNILKGDWRIARLAAELLEAREQLLDQRILVAEYHLAIERATPILHSGGRYSHLMRLGESIIISGPEKLAEHCDALAAALLAARKVIADAIEQSHRWREQLATSCEKRDRLIDEIIRLRRWTCNCDDPKQEPCPVHESQAFKAQMQAMRDADQARRTVGVDSRHSASVGLREDPVQPVGEGEGAAARQGDAAVSTGDRRQEVSTPAQPAHAPVEGFTEEDRREIERFLDPPDEDWPIFSEALARLLAAYDRERERNTWKANLTAEIVRAEAERDAAIADEQEKGSTPDSRADVAPEGLRRPGLGDGDVSRTRPEGEHTTQGGECGDEAPCARHGVPGMQATERSRATQARRVQPDEVPMEVELTQEQFSLAESRWIQCVPTRAMAYTRAGLDVPLQDRLCIALLATRAALSKVTEERDAALHGGVCSRCGATGCLPICAPCGIAVERAQDAETPQGDHGEPVAGRSDGSIAAKAVDSNVGPASVLALDKKWREEAHKFFPTAPNNPAVFRYASERLAEVEQERASALAALAAAQREAEVLRSQLEGVESMERINEAGYDARDVCQKCGIERANHPGSAHWSEAHTFVHCCDTAPEPSEEPTACAPDHKMLIEACFNYQVKLEKAEASLAAAQREAEELHEQVRRYFGDIADLRERLARLKDPLSLPYPFKEKNTSGNVDVQIVNIVREHLLDPTRRRHGWGLEENRALEDVREAVRAAVARFLGEEGK